MGSQMAKTRSQRTLIGRSKNAFYWLIGERTKLQRRTQLQRYRGFRFSRGQTENRVPRSFFTPKPNGNACYAGYSRSRRLGELLKATTSTSWKMFLKRSVECRMGCYLRSMSWMLGRARWVIGDYKRTRSVVSLVVFFSLLQGFVTGYRLCSWDLFFNKASFVTCSGILRYGSPPNLHDLEKWHLKRIVLISGHETWQTALARWP